MQARTFTESARRAQIVTAAIEVIAEVGYAKASFSRIAKQAALSSTGMISYHFAGKDDLVAEYLRRFDPEIMAGVFDRTDLTPRERLLAAFELPASGSDELTPLCPYIEAAVEIHDPRHPASQYARDYKLALAARLAAAAREGGATDPEQLGEQLALLLDGASARNRVLGAETFATAAAIAVVLIDNAIPMPAGGELSRS